MTALAPDAEGPLSAEERAATVAAILARQQPSGMIPWAAGQGADPWNHLEAVMALALAGEHDAVARALEWLVGVQQANGAFAAGFGTDGAVADQRRDTNGTAYLAFALHAVERMTGDADLVRALWPAAERALGFVCAQQRPGGEICWSDAAPGAPGDLALVAAGSSIYASLRAAERLAAALDLPLPPGAVAAADRLGVALRWGRERFVAKDEYAMDWYYPVLAGVLDGNAGRHRLDAGWGTFVQPGRGVLCTADRRWVTAAETAECALACLRVGRDADAAALVSWTAAARRPDGAYLTGLVYPERSTFPPGEETTYTAAAVLLAADALDGGPARAVFADA